MSCSRAEIQLLPLSGHCVQISISGAYPNIKAVETIPQLEHLQLIIMFYTLARFSGSDVTNAAGETLTYLAFNMCQKDVYTPHRVIPQIFNCNTVHAITLLGATFMCTGRYD